MIGWVDAGGDKRCRDLLPLGDQHLQEEFFKKAHSLLLPSGFRDAGEPDCKYTDWIEAGYDLGKLGIDEETAEQSKHKRRKKELEDLRAAMSGDTQKVADRFNELHEKMHEIYTFGFKTGEFPLHTWIAELIFSALNWSALLVIAGVMLLMRRRLTHAGQIAVQTFEGDWLPLMLLLAISVIGLGITLDNKFMMGEATVGILSLVAMARKMRQR